MPDLIPRDAGDPFDDELQQQELLEFMCPPDTYRIFEDLAFEAEGSRALRLFDPNLIAGLAVPGPVDPPPDEDPLVPPPDPDFLPTPDRVAAEFFADHRGLHDLFVTVPGFGNVEVWSFRDNPTGVATWPAPTIRVREGQVVHSRFSNRRGPHTIHHHGIEPTSANDGVGHLTFDVGSGVVYDYQWQAAEAGTYFYHCHVNTVLHFEMGMYGMLIIDPDVDGAPFQDGGPGQTWVGNTIVPYDREAIWVADDIDTRWHSDPVATHGHDRRAGIECGEFMAINHPDNPRLHNFNPDVFLVSGQPAPYNQDEAVIDAAGVTVQRGERLLVRALNASYTTTRWQFPAPFAVTAIADDARTFGREPFGRYSSPINLNQAPFNNRFMLTTARRWDLMIDTAAVPAGTHLVDIHFHHWITDFRLRTVRVPIVVNP